MGYSLLWVEEDIESVSDDVSFQVARNLEEALQSKEDEIKWCKNMAQLSKRFQSVFNLEGLTVAEIRFSALSAEYRALCVVISEKETVVYYETVPKKGSFQERRLQIMRENADEIKSAIQKNIS